MKTPNKHEIIEQIQVLLEKFPDGIDYEGLETAPPPAVLAGQIWRLLNLLQK